MTELQGRGYLIAYAANYLRDNVSKDEWKRINGELSPELQGLLSSGDVKHAGFYRISLLNELTNQIVTTIGRNDDAKAREALFTCGKYIAREATNTFLRLLLKMLTPSLLVKKLPEVFRRDFTMGRVTSELNGRTLTVHYYDVPGFQHCGATSPGFVATAFETMGKTVENLTVHDWSLAQPNVDGTWFELTWKD
jgi:hypothetical protein